MTLRDDLIRDEGSIPYGYKDSLGYLTLGVGFLIDKNQGGDLPDQVRDFWLDYLIAQKEKELDRAFPWAAGLPEPVRRGLLNMLYNLGLSRLQGFHNMLAALQAGDWEKAATEALASSWAAQVGERAIRIAALFRGPHG